MNENLEKYYEELLKNDKFVIVTNHAIVWVRESLLQCKPSRRFLSEVQSTYDEAKINPSKMIGINSSFSVNILDYLNILLSIWHEHSPNNSVKDHYEYEDGCSLGINSYEIVMKTGSSSWIFSHKFYVRTNWSTPRKGKRIIK